MGQKVDAMAFRQGQSEAYKIAFASKDEAFRAVMTEKERMAHGLDSSLPTRIPYSESSLLNASMENAKDYGHWLNISQAREKFLSEFFLGQGFMVSRIVFDLKGAKREASAEVLEMRTGETPLRTNAELDRARMRIASMIEKKFGVKVVVTFEVLNYRIRADKKAQGIQETMRANWLSRCPALRRDGKPKRRVRPASLREGMMRALRFPVTPGLTKMFALHLEDSFKQADGITELKAGMNRAGLDGNGSSSSGVEIQGVTCTGVVMKIKGVIDGSRRTRSERLALGRCPRSGLRYPVSSYKGIARTKTGTRGLELIYFYSAF